MIAKELLDARWRFLAGGIVTLCFAFISVGSYDWIRGLLDNPQVRALGGDVQQQLGQVLGNFDTYAWGQWYAKNAPLILGAVAAFLGGGLIAGEVGKGTIFFLLSKPIGRTRVLLLKFAVAAGLLLGVDLLGSLTLFVTAAVLGHAPPLGGLLLSTLLMWLGPLCVLSVALLFSVWFDDVLRPVALAMLVGVVIGLPGLVGSFVPDWRPWSLPGYWASFPAYLGTAFPGRELLICLIAALLPVAVALPLFRSRQY